MGKNKAQRTKNNARPSSSGRSAQLLETSSFVGFPTLAEGGAFSLPVFSGLAGLQLDEGENQSVNPQLQLTLKKMNKKDAITRLKALQEFADQCQTLEAEELKAVLRFWPRMFSALATDPDHRVREATQRAHHQLAKQAGRNIAPHLKALAGPWFVGQFDTFAPAASAASQAFQDSFPGQKFPEAIKFCQKEIISYISENLLSQTMETVAYQKSLSAEELEARQERVLSSNLLGYQLYLRQLPQPELRLAQDSNKTLITSSKFWKLSKHKVPLVRRAWFSALSGLLQEAPFLLEDQGSQVAPAVFGNLDESDPTVLPAVWEAALYALVAIKDCWSFVNCEKMVFPKLWHILRDGGQGNAAAIFPNLLPLLSKITPQDKSVFYSKFFSNMCQGLGQKTVQQSSAESNAVVTAFVECFRYVVTMEDSTEMLELLMNEQLLILVQKCTTDRKLHLTLNPLATQISDLLQSWTGNSNMSNLVALFWQHMTKVCNGISELQNPETAFQSFTDFLVLLLDPAKIKKSRKVNFSTEKEKNEGTEKVLEPSEVLSLPYSEPLIQLAYQIGKHVLTSSQATKYPNTYIDILLKITKSFGSKTYFETLSGTCFNFFNEPLQAWLNNTEINVKPVVELTFIVLKYMELHEKQEALQSFCKNGNRVVLQLCIAESIEAGKEDTTILEWLRCPDLNVILVDLAKEVSNVLDTNESDKSSAWNILKLCFSSCRDGGLVISTETVSAILRVFCDALTVSTADLKDDAALDSCASFVGELTNSLFSQQLKLCQATLQELLLATFKLCCGRIGLSAAARESLQNAWKNGISYLELSNSEMYKLCEKFSKFAHENFTLTNTQSVMCSAQFLTVTEDPEVLQIFLKLPLKYLEWQKQLENVVVVTDIVNSAMYWVNDKPIPIATNVDCLFNYINAMLFNVTLLRELSTLTDVHDEDTQLLIQDKSIEAIYCICICDKIVSQYKSKQSCYKVLVDYERLLDNVTSLIKKLSADKIQNVITHVLRQMKNGAYQWVWSLPKFLEWYPESKGRFQKELLVQSEGEWEPWKLWVMQAIPTLLDDPSLSSLVSEHTTKLLAEEKPLCQTFMVINFNQLSNDQLKKVLDMFLKFRQQGQWNSVFKDDSIDKNEFVGVVKVLILIIKSRSWLVTPRHWDSLLCSLASWMQEARECVIAQPTNPQYTATLIVLCNLLSNIQSHIYKIQEDDELRAKNPKHLLDEWRSLFVPELYSILMTFFYAAIENKVPTVWEQFKLQMIGLCLFRVPLDWFITHELPKHLNKGNKRITVQERNIENIVRLLCSLLHHEEKTLQVTAYHLIRKLVTELVEKDEAYRMSEDIDSVDPSKLSCELLGLELAATHDVVETMLMDFSVGDCCIVEPFTDSHLYTQAYLLTWSIMLDLCKEAKSELRYHYARWLSNAAYTNTMLDIVFRLMPDYVVHQFELKANTTVSKKCSDLFTKDYMPSFVGYNTASGIQQAACWVYRRSLLHLPALVRTWWNDSDVRVAGMVERLTAALVSPIVCASEMKAVQDHEKNFSNMAVKVHQSAREVVATYIVDEVRMELTISLPANHPLGPVKVEGNKPAIDIAKWKQWVMQLTIFLTHQNGSIWDGLMLWKRNLDNKFEGVEECYICYSVLHGTNYQIPKLSCHTCHKKFHSSCLYRWFHTSNNSTCPICRNLF